MTTTMTTTLLSRRHPVPPVIGIAGACLVASLLVMARPAQAQSVVPTSPLTDGNGRSVGYYTNEPSVYFLYPSHWGLLTNARTPPVRITEVIDGCNRACHPGANPSYDLRLVLTPDYTYAAPAVVSVTNQDPDALFFPLPSTISEVTLFLPGALGNIQAQLVPDENGLSTPVALYYRLRFDSVQLEILRQLSRGGLTLQGTVQYAYLAPGNQTQWTTAPMTIRLNEADLSVSTAPPPDPTAWIGDLLATNQMFVRGAIDGPYSLGGGIAINITNSVVEGHFIPATWALTHDGVSVITVVPTANPNYTGRISFSVPQLGFNIQADYRATVSVALDLMFMEVILPQLSITSVTINGSTSPFYTLLLGQLMQSSTVRDRVSQSLTEELQRRILAQTLFGLGNVLD